MRRTAIAAAVAAIVAMPAHAASSVAIKAEIAEMPFVRALAYQIAVDKWCFLESKLKNSELSSLGLTQAAFTDVDGEEAANEAWKHLARDNTACGPAADFVKRTINNLPTLKPKFDELTRKLVKAQNDEQALAEKKRIEQEKALAEQRAKAEAENKAAKAEADLKACQAAAGLADYAANDRPYEQDSQLHSKARYLKTYCANYLTADQIAAANATFDAERVNVEKRLAAKRAEMDKIAARPKKPETLDIQEPSPPAMDIVTTCRFKGLASMTIAYDDKDGSWLTIGKAEPIRLSIGREFSSATTADGKEVLLSLNGVTFDGKFYKGSCKPH